MPADLVQCSSAERSRVFFFAKHYESTSVTTSKHMQAIEVFYLDEILPPIQIQSKFLKKHKNYANSLSTGFTAPPKFNFKTVRRTLYTPYPHL